MSGMHLLPVYYSTTNTKKRKKQKKTKSLLAAEKEHEKFLKDMGIGQSKRGRSSVGRASGLQPEGRQFDSVRLHQTQQCPAESDSTRSVAQSGSASALGAEGQRFKSSRSDQCFYDPSSAKKEEKVYTGDEIIGIAQMHKSNAVPVRGKKQATEVANMRRN